MKLTKRQLRRIIKEEKAKLLKEADHGGGWNGSYGGSTMEGFDLMETISSILAEAGVTLDAVSWQAIEEGINDLSLIHI